MVKSKVWRSFCSLKCRVLRHHNVPAPSFKGNAPWNADRNRKKCEFYCD